MFNIEGLKNHAIKIKLNFSLNLSSHFNIQSTKNWDISTTAITSFTWNVEISRRLYSMEDLSDYLRGLLPDSAEYETSESDDTAAYTKAVTEILTDVFEDATDGEIILIEWPLPVTAVPGLTVNVQVKICLDFSLYARANIGNELIWKYAVGSTLIDKKFDTYSSIECESDNLTISMGGKFKAKLGLRIDVMAEFIDDDVAHIRIGPEAGVYAEAFASVPLISDKYSRPTNYWGYYFEPGLYFNISAGAYINYLIGDVEYELEVPVKRIPFEKLILGDAIIPLGISLIQESVVAVADKVTPPDFQLEFFNVKDGVFSSDGVDSLDLDFSLEDGTILERDSSGRIILPDGFAVQTETILYATYTHSDGREHAASFEILCGDLTIDTEYFAVLLPQDWLEKYVVEPTDTGATIYEKENYLISDGMLGELVSVDLWSADEDYSYLPSYEYKDSCVVDGDEYDILALYPSDVQFYDPDLMPYLNYGPADKDYASLYNDLADDLYEYRGNRDNSTDHLRVSVKNEYAN